MGNKFTVYNIFRYAGHLVDKVEPEQTVAHAGYEVGALVWIHSGAGDQQLLEHDGAAGHSVVWQLPCALGSGSEPSVFVFACHRDEFTFNLAALDLSRLGAFGALGVESRWACGYQLSRLECEQTNFLGLFAESLGAIAHGVLASGVATRAGVAEKDRALDSMVLIAQLVAPVEGLELAILLAERAVGRRVVARATDSHLSAGSSSHWLQDVSIGLDEHGGFWWFAYRLLKLCGLAEISGATESNRLSGCLHESSEPAAAPSAV